MVSRKLFQLVGGIRFINQINDLRLGLSSHPEPSAQLNSSTDFFDFIEFDVFSPDNIGIFHQLFAEHQVWQDTDRLVFDLVLVLFEVLRGSDRRVEKSSNEVNYPKNIRKAFIQRLKVSVEDPIFARKHGINPREVEEEIKRYETEIKEMSKPNAKRAGQTKNLVHLLVPVIIRLNINGLERPQRVSFLHDLFVIFESPEFGGKYTKAEKWRIRQWDRAASKLSSSRQTIMGITFND